MYKVFLPPAVIVPSLSAGSDRQRPVTSALQIRQRPLEPEVHDEKKPSAYPELCEDLKRWSHLGVP